MSPESGGTTQAIAGLTRSLVSLGAQVDTVTTARRDSPRTRGDGIRAFREGWLGGVWTGHAPGLSDFLSTETHGYDLVHIHELWHHAHFSASTIAHRVGRPYVVSPHGMLSTWALAHKAWKKRVYWAAAQGRTLKRATAIHAMTADEVTDIRGRGLVNRVALITNGIEPEEYRDLPPKDALSRIYPQLAGKQVVLFLGRIHPIKGLDLLASAFGSVARDRDDVRLVIAGPNTYGYRSRVETMLSEQQVLEKSVFTGMLTGTEKLAALSGSDILVLPSYSEASPIVTLEAMTCGMPVIATRVGGYPEVAQAGAGMIIDTDSQQLASALRTMLESQELRRSMGKRGQELVEERFTWDRIGGQMLELYQDLVHSR